MSIAVHGAQGLQYLPVVTQLRRAVLAVLESSHTRGTLSRGRRHVIHAAPGVRVEVEKPLVLALQRRQQREQRDVLVHVSEIAGVIGVAILHRLTSVWR